ncbi:inositol monophosphatase family protein [Geodermatophilus sp. SYSU D01176]
MVAATPSGCATSDVELAGTLARTAGERLQSLRRHGPDLSSEELRVLGDTEAQAVLAAGLAAARPGDAVLSEESTDDRTRLGKARVWIIDPLDGTREYSEGRADWAVHVALWERGSLVTGAVALPAVGLLLTSDPAPVVPPRDEGSPLRMAVSRSRPPWPYTQPRRWRPSWRAWAPPVSR